MTVTRNARSLSRSIATTLAWGAAVGSILGPTPRLHAQGCVASPNNASCMLHHPDGATPSDRFSATIAYRYFESARHFGGRSRAGAWLDGDEENTDRQKYHQEMINRVSLFNVSLAYQFTTRCNATLDLPFIVAERSSVFEHTDGQRHTMRANGLGDIRLLTDYWLLDPHKHMNGNVAVGIGVKTPTGDDNATDISYRSGGRVRRPVDQSIQPGDGGWGLILQLQAYQKIYRNLSAYAQGNYLFSPEEQNDTQRVMGDVGAPNAMTFNSISDQYFGRVGLSQALWPSHGLGVSLGARIEGVPVYDAIGDSLGYRQPGYTVSVEPGLSWMGKKNSLSILAPVAVYRNRERSAAEKAMNRRGGDASFADFSILASFRHQF